MIHESLIQRVIADQRQQQESISKIILGATVDGCQTTVTDVTADLVADDSRIRVDLINTGYVTSRTRSFNSQAAIDSTGQHQFLITKPFCFDGVRLLTQRCFGTIHASQTPVRVLSSASTIPLIGPVSDQVAWSEVLRRSPEIDRAVAEDLSTDILPKIDRSSDPELAMLSRQLTTLRARADAWLQPEQFRLTARSTDNAAFVWMHSPGNSPDPAPTVAADATAGFAVEDDDESVVVLISEDLATRIALGRIPRGLKITDLQLNSILSAVGTGSIGTGNNGTDRTLTLMELTARLTALLSALNPDDVGNPTVGVYSIELPERDSLRVLFRDGEVKFRSKIQIVPRFGPVSGWQTVEARIIGLPLANDQWSPVVTGISPVDSIPAELDSAASSATVTAGTAWSQLIQSTTATIVEKLPAVRLPRVVRMPVSDPRLADSLSAKSNLPDLRLHRIRAENGVLRISFRTLNSTALP